MLRLCPYASAYMSLNMSQASLRSFVLPFVCPYAYAASENQALSASHWHRCRHTTEMFN